VWRTGIGPTPENALSLGLQTAARVVASLCGAYILHVSSLGSGSRREATTDSPV
jgi:hypothetical protein